MGGSLKLRLFEIIEKAPKGDKASKIFDTLIISLIIINVIAVILASFETLKLQYQKKEELSVTLFITFLLLLLSSSIMYYVETDVQPDAFPNIIAAFWWGVATLTTVGYGDVYPITVIGKILSGIIALLGIGLVALPTGIISSGFMDQMSQKRKPKEERKKKSYCPYCGEKLKK